MLYRKAIAVAVFAAALPACSSTSDTTTVAPSSPSTTTTAAAIASAQPSTATPINEVEPGAGAVQFTRADNGAAIGSATLAEVKRVPATCGSEPVGADAQLVAVRSVLTGASTVNMPRPDTTTLIPVDDAGTTYPAAQAILATACRSDYPEPGQPVPGGRTDGWTVVAVPVAATSLRYYPITSDDGGFVKPSPAFVAAPIPA